MTSTVRTPRTTPTTTPEQKALEAAARTFMQNQGTVLFAAASPMAAHNNNNSSTFGTYRPNQKVDTSTCNIDVRFYENAPESMLNQTASPTRLLEQERATAAAHYHHQHQGSPQRNHHQQQQQQHHNQTYFGPGVVYANNNNNNNTHNMSGGANFNASTATSAVSAQRSVVPLPTTLDDAAAQNALQMMTNQQHQQSRHNRTAQHSGVVFHNTSALNLNSVADRTTFSQTQKSSHHRSHSASGHRSAIRNASSFNSSSAAAPSAFGCCSDKGLRTATEGKKKIPGLFVTYCEHSLETQMLEARRNLEYEQDMRAQDEHKHQAGLIKVLRNLRATETERDRLLAENDELKRKLHEESRTYEIVRGELDHRWREAETQLSQTREELARLSNIAETSKIGENTKEHRIDILELSLKETKEALDRVQKDSVDNAHRAQLYFEERSVFEKKANMLERELKRATEMLSIKETAVRGLEKELRGATEKLSSVAVLRESLRKKGAPGGEGESGMVATSSKLQNKLMSAVRKR